MHHRALHTIRQHPMNTTGATYPPVLVVEDDEMIARLLVGHLQDSGYVVLTATTKDEAIQLIRENKFGMIVVDTRISGINLRELRIVTKTAEKTSDILPISNLAHEEEVGRLWEEGLFFDFIKLTDPSQFDSALVELAIRKRFELQKREKLQEMSRERRR